MERSPGSRGRTAARINIDLNKLGRMKRAQNGLPETRDVELDGDFDRFSIANVNELGFAPGALGDRDYGSDLEAECELLLEHGGRA